LSARLTLATSGKTTLLPRAKQSDALDSAESAAGDFRPIKKGRTQRGSAGYDTLPAKTTAFCRPLNRSDTLKLRQKRRRRLLSNKE